MPTIHNGDCIETMNAMPAESVDSIVTDPPYGLSFMGRKWDGLPPSLEWAEACYRVLKPGGHIAAFGGTRTWHRLAVAIEDAGFEMRDSLAWLYGSGFPKSLDVSKAIDKAAGAEREVVGLKTYGEGQTFTGSAKGGRSAGHMGETVERGPSLETAPATPDAERWTGWGTALKPAFEPIVLARKPLAEKTVARNVLAHGTGAINVDACRIGTDEDTSRAPSVVQDTSAPFGTGIAMGGRGHSSGRWPANVLLDQHAAAWVDEQSGHQKDGFHVGRNRNAEDDMGGYSGAWKKDSRDGGYGGSGGASRFFYSAKAPKTERPSVDGVQHPTVKPLAIMRWLLRLTTPPGGTVLDPFAGSGTTVEAAIIEGFNPIGIEMEPDYLPLIQHRIDRQAATLTA